MPKSSSLSIAIAACFVSVTCCFVIANYLLPLEGNPRLAVNVGIVILAACVGIGILAFRRHGRHLDNAQRHRYQFTILTMLVAVGLAAIVVWWAAREIHIARQRRDLLADFHARGGSTLLEANANVQRFVIPNNEFTDEEVARLRAAFPEAIFSQEMPNRK